MRNRNSSCKSGANVEKEEKKKTSGLGLLRMCVESLSAIERESHLKKKRGGGQGGKSKSRN